MSNALDIVARQVGVLLDPARRIVADEDPPHELMRLLGRAGWAVPGLGDVDLQSLNAALGAGLNDVDALAVAVRSGTLADVVSSLEATAQAIAAVRDLDAAFDALRLNPPPGTGAALAEDVAEALALAWLARRPKALSLARALALVPDQTRPAVVDGHGTVLRSGTSRPHLALDALPGLLADP